MDLYCIICTGLAMDLSDSIIRNIPNLWLYYNMGQCHMHSIAIKTSNSFVCDNRTTSISTVIVRHPAIHYKLLV